MSADPKPAPRIIDPLAGLVKLRREGECRICGKTQNLTRHHLVPRSQGGDDVDDNLAILDGSGVSGCHGDVEARRAQARSRLRERLWASEEAYVISKKGLAWLDRHYPRGAS